MYTRSLWRLFTPLAVLWLSSLPVLADDAPSPPAAQSPPAELIKPSIVYKVQASDERLEMIVHTSRILTTEQKISQSEVSNPDILELTPLSPNQVQISGKATGVTQVNLWDENKKLFTIDVRVIGDARELEMILRSAFPNAALKVTPVATNAMISGFVDKNEHIAHIIEIAEQYYPKVINNMTVGGCQQVALHVKIMEVSRTKLRRLGFDWAKINGSNMVASGASGLILPPSSPTLPSGVSAIEAAAPTTNNNPISATFAFNIVNGASAFFGVLDALRQDDLAKIMAEPTLVTVSGRPAYFKAGGSFYIVPQGLAASQPIQVNYGTELGFVPIVLGNGRIHLDVRPEVSAIDPSLSVQGYPGLLDRKAETGVELAAGQTLAIAGLVQSRTEAENSGLPWISEVPYLGAAFRKVHEQTNEVELLIMVTPELVEALDANEVPPCGPGMQTTSPSDWELFMKGHLEVPKCPNSCPQDAAHGDGCRTQGDNSSGPPPDGMIGPSEQVPLPPSADTSRRSQPQNRNSRANPNSAGPATPPASQNGPPGFIGPVGYDVVK